MKRNDLLVVLIPALLCLFTQALQTFHMRLCKLQLAAGRDLHFGLVAARFHHQCGQARAGLAMESCPSTSGSWVAPAN